MTSVSVGRPVPLARPPRRALNRPWLLGAAALLLVLWALAQSGLWTGTLVNPGGWALVHQFVRASVHPAIGADILALAFQSSLVTAAYAICGTALALVIGAVGGVLSAEVWWLAVLPSEGRRPAAHVAWLIWRAGLAVPRAFHEVIWALLLLNTLGLTPLTAVLALAIHYGGITAKVFGEALDETPREAFHALRHAGASPLQALCYGLLPRAFPDLLAYAFYRFECAIRSAVVLGMIGAGGLGFQMLLSLQSLRYEEMWTFLYALIALCGLTDLWSGALRQRLHLPARLAVGRRPGSTVLPERDRIITLSVALVTLLVPWAFWYLRPGLGRLFQARTYHLFASVLRDALPPRLDTGTLSTLWHLSLATLSMSILAMLLAGVGGLVLAFAAARGLGQGRKAGGFARPLLARAVLLVSRAVSAPIWALIAVFVLFPGVLPGAIGLGLFNLGVIGRLLAESIENLDPRPIQALEVQGAGRTQVIAYGILPRLMPRAVSYLLYRWEECIRATVIVGLVGAGGLGRLLTEQLSSFDYRGVSATLLAFLLLTFLVDLASQLARRSIR